MQKENLQFGHGSFVGALARDPEFLEMSDQEVAEIAGWANGCPVVQELTSPEGGRGGPEVMARRYGEVNFWFRYMAAEAAKLNPKLSYVFDTPQARLESEPVGDYETESVPDNYPDQMAPLGTLVGYSLPRLFVEQIGANQDISREDRTQRLNAGLSIIEKNIAKADSAESLLAGVASDISQSGSLDPVIVLKRVLGKGWYSEHGATTMMDRFKAVLEHEAPELWNVYENLTPEEKAANGIA